MDVDVDVVVDLDGDGDVDLDEAFDGDVGPCAGSVGDPKVLGLRQRSDDQDHVNGGLNVHVAVAVHDHVNVKVNDYVNLRPG